MIYLGLNAKSCQENTISWVQVPNMAYLK